MPIIGVSNVGVMVNSPWEGWKVVGRSLAIGINGEILAIGPYYEEALIPVDVELRLPRAYGTNLLKMVRDKEKEIEKRLEELRRKGYIGP